MHDVIVKQCYRRLSLSRTDLLSLRHTNLLNISKIDLLSLCHVDLLILSNVDLLSLPHVDLLSLSHVDTQKQASKSQLWAQHLNQKSLEHVQMCRNEPSMMNYSIGMDWMTLQKYSFFCNVGNAGRIWHPDAQPFLSGQVNLLVFLIKHLTLTITLRQSD